MRKGFKYFGLLLILGALSFITYQVVNKREKIEQAFQTLNEISSFELKDLNQEPFLFSSLGKEYKIIIYIDTSCHFCIEQINQIESIHNSLENVAVVFVSQEDITDLKQFYTSNQIFINENIFLAHDNTSIFTERLGISTTPHILIYNTDWELIHNHRGFLKAEKLLELVQSSPNE